MGLLKYLKLRLKQRIDILANWTSKNPTLLKGEIGIIENRNRMKVGDGSTAFNSLNYFNAPVIKDITLLAKNWTNATYVVSDSNIFADSVILFDAPVGVVQKQYELLQEANIIAVAQIDGKLTLRAMGVVPTVDVTATFVFM